MKRHLFGLMIFGLIVGAAVAVKPFLFAPNESNFMVINGSYCETSGTSYWRMRRQHVVRIEPGTADSGNVKIRQAVLDWNDKRMDWEIYNPKAFSSLALHLFVKDAHGIRYIATDIAPFSSTFSNKTVRYSSKYSFNELSPSENLYVVPEVISNADADAKNYNPIYDENLAVPVTVLTEKSSQKTRID